jgi:alkyl hydroperoxide reductase subunit AhpC
MSARVGKPAPAFTAPALVGSDFKDVSLSDFAGKYVVLFFYPLDFTFVCPTEILEFNAAAARIREAGAELIGASVDSQFSHLAWTKTSRKTGGLGGALNFPLIADLTKKVCCGCCVCVLCVWVCGCVGEWVSFRMQEKALAT